jgi:hypothetical protein
MASEGYNLHDLKAGKWTAAMKRRVTMYQREMHELTAQEKIIVRTRSPKKLEYAQRMGGHEPGYKFKVAFVPGSSKAKIIWNDDGSMTVREPGFDRLKGEFDREALAVDPDGEVRRVLSADNMQGANRFVLVTGKNLRLGSFADASHMISNVKKLQNQYDGKKPLPSSSGNKNKHGKNDNPSAHHWSQWMIGVEGFKFKKMSTAKRRAKLASIRRANIELQRRRANERARVREANKRARK